jgi:hypothetical protein
MRSATLSGRPAVPNSRRLLGEHTAHQPSNSLPALQIPSRGSPAAAAPGLADVELRADRTRRRNSGRRQLPGQQLRRPLPRWVRVMPGIGRTARRSLGTADDHHEELVRTDQCSGGPGAYRRDGQAAAQALRHISASVAAMPKTSSHRASAGNGVLRRAVKHRRRTRVDQMGVWTAGFSFLDERTSPMYEATLVDELHTPSEVSFGYA